MSERAVHLRLRRHEVEVLAGLPDQLRALLGLGEGQVHDRLFPRAYLDHTEEEAEQEWQRLMHEELLAGKVAALEVVEETLGRVEGGGTLSLSEEEAMSWLLALNDVRLALGTMLEVTDDTDPAAVRPDDPRAPGLHLYGWLTWLQGSLIEAVERP